MQKVIKNDAKLHHRSSKTTTVQNQNSDFLELREVLTSFKNRLTTKKSLTNTNRKRLTTVGRERRLFTHQSLMTALEHKGLIPVDSTPQEIQEWIETEAVVLNVFTELEALKRAVYDFYYELTHQEYQTALNIYRRAKTGSREGVKGMPAVYETLKKAYMSTHRQKKEAVNTMVLVE